MKGWRRLLGGMTCVATLVASWVAMAEILQDIQKGGSKYEKPFFLTYFIRSGYSVTLFPWAIWRFFISSEPISRQEIDNRLLAYAFGLCLFGAASSYTWYYSLQSTIVSANTAIYNCACIIVFILSFIFLGESATIYKFIAVIFCIVGMAVVCIYGLKDKNEESSTVGGYILVIVSMIFYSVYEVGYGIYGKDKNVRPSTSLLFLGIFGLWIAFTLWPFLIILHYTGVERFELPSGDALTATLVSMGLDIVLNLSVLIGVQITSPLMMAVGTILTIPASVVADKIVQDIFLSWEAYIGMALILVGFVILNISEEVAWFKNTKYQVTFHKRQLIWGKSREESIVINVN